jgi:hypothetical protein
MRHHDVMNGRLPGFYVAVDLDLIEVLRTFTNGCTELLHDRIVVQPKTSYDMSLFWILSGLRPRS